MNKRIFVSSTGNRNLDERRRSLKAAIIDKISKAGYEPQEFGESGIPANLAWSFTEVNRVMSRCAGAIVLGFARWNVVMQPDGASLISEYNHYHGAVALTHGLPILILAERGVADRGVVWSGGGKVINYLPDDANENWMNDPKFTTSFGAWLRDIEKRKDVFLGYCSKSAGTAAQLQIRLEGLGASVLNWAMDFRPGSSILSEIENARAMCSCGIFLFSEDDPMEGMPGGAAPRDNVVFEAGYFMSAKGPDRCLIVRQGDAKMPADVGGAIYVQLEKSGDVGAIEGRLAKFLVLQNS